MTCHLTGRKRHILTDTDGGSSQFASMLPTCRIATTASYAQRFRQRYPSVTHVFADGGYADRFVHWAADKTDITL